MDKLKVSIVMPVYNEEFSVKDTIERVKEVMSKSHLKHEIIVINDGSQDGSKKILESVSGIKLINHPNNKGYGASLKNGIHNSIGEFILIIDADGNSSPEDIPKILKYFEDYDMVIGTRIGFKNVPILRRVARFLITFIANFLTKKKIPDVNSGFRIFKRDLVLKFFHLLPEGFSLTTTLTLAALINNYDVIFVPVNYSKRDYGKSKIKPLSDFLGFIQLMLRIMVYFNPLRIFSLFSFLILLCGIILFFYSTFILGEVLDITLTIVLLTSLQVFILGIIADLIVRSRK